MTRALHRGLVLLAVAVASVSGCTDDIPSTSLDDAVYTLWGRLDPTSSTQAVRVSPILKTADAEEPASLDVTVTTTHLRTGDVTTWRDSSFTFPSGRLAHVFLADFRPEYGAAYLFRVRRPDGQETTAQFTVPPRVVPTFAPSEPVPEPIQLILPAAPRIVGAKVTYAIRVLRSYGQVGPARGDLIEETVIDSEAPELYEFGWTLPVRFGVHTGRLDQRMIDLQVKCFTVEGIRIGGAVANETWAAPYPLSFSRELLIQPTAVTNVDNGFGFVGAAYAFDVVWPFDPLVIQRADLVNRDSRYRMTDPPCRSTS